MIASRRSALARIQAEAVGRALAKLNPGVEVRYHWVRSAGDKVTDQPLAAVGGKGLFTKAIDEALKDGDADLAVHSLKDVPTTLPAGLRLAATPKRGPVADVLLTRAGVERVQDLPVGTVVGTTSPRRAAQLRQLNPQLRVALLRGNVDTRLEAVTGGEPTHDATLLAAAGLLRLGRTKHGGSTLPVDELMPAVAQGALGIVCRGDDHVTLRRCLPLNCPTTNTAVTAERQLVQLLRADCHSPVAALAEPVDPALTRAERNADSHWFRLRAKAVSIDGKRAVDFDEQCKTRDLRRVVARAADAMRERGADAILKEAKAACLFDAEAKPRSTPRPSIPSPPAVPTPKQKHYAE